MSSRSPDVGPEGEHDEECPHEEVAEAGDGVDAEEAEDAGEKVEEHEGAEEGGGRAGSLEHILRLILLNVLQEQLVYLLEKKKEKLVYLLGEKRKSLSISWGKKGKACLSPGGRGACGNYRESWISTFYTD